MPVEKPWPIVTLTTDFGWRDYSLAQLKGSILSQQRRVQLVDISHDIPSFDIVQAAFVFRNAYHYYPKGSIHVLSVNDHYQPGGRYLALMANDSYFIGPDNGIFSLVFDDLPTEAYYLDVPSQPDFSLKTLYARAISHIVRDRPFYEIGMPAVSLERRISLQPVIGPDYIRGAIIYVDKYENATTNISQQLFNQVGQGRSFSLYFKRHDPIEQLYAGFNLMPEGEPGCRFNGAGLLEITIKMGRAASLLGLHPEDTVQIDFAN